MKQEIKPLTVVLNGKEYPVQTAIDTLYKMVKENSPKAVTSAANLLALFSEKERCAPTESFYVLFLDHANKVIKKKKISTGVEEQTPVYPRQVMRECLKFFATGIIVVHNHPTGQTKPSKADLEITKNLAVASATLDIRFVDHIIISSQGYFSFRENGMIS